MDKLTLYFDKSWFTGENLLSEEQETFVYASINITPAEVEALVSKNIKFRMLN